MMLALLAGCLMPWGMGAEENDGISPDFESGDGGATSSGAPPSIEDVDADVVDETALTFAARGGSGTISVEQLLLGKCATSWSGADVEVEGSTLAVSYDTSTPDTASPECTWQVRYDIVRVEPGDWTVSAGGQTAAVTVSR